MSVSKIPIRYFLVEDNRSRSRGTVMHLVSAAEVPLLRSFMALAILPTSTADLSTTNGPFASATKRLGLPSFRSLSEIEPTQSIIWHELESAPLLIFFIPSTIPQWMWPLVDRREIGILTSSEELFESISSVHNIKAGLLKRDRDIVDSYRVIQQLIDSAALNNSHSPEIRQHLSSFSSKKLLADSPKLNFFPGLPLPQPHEGRSAVYLINRLSNTSSVQGIAADEDEFGGLRNPQILEMGKMAAAAFALLETGMPLPSNIPVPKDVLEQTHEYLQSNDDHRKAFFEFLNTGRLLASGKTFNSPLYAIAAPRLDLIKGRVPSNVTLDANHKRDARMALKVLKDFSHGTRQTEFKNDQHKEAYENTLLTLQTEQRLISLQVAWIASRTGCIPIQLAPVSGILFSLVRDLQMALAVDGRKIPRLFNRVQLALANIFPNECLSTLEQGTGPVLFYGDLPFEWTIVGEWPICLTRPVSRIPLGLGHWDVLCAALEGPHTVDSSRPDKVLVFDLIKTHDPIRSFSDAFRHASEEIGQNYTYASPTSAKDFQDVLHKIQPQIVVLDSHGSYDFATDQLLIQVGSENTSITELLSSAAVPPIWILSACDTAMTGAIQGDLVKALLARGAVCVVATLSRIDAFTASIFVGRLLTELFNPLKKGMYETFGEIFFSAQYTTALLYDPLLPIFRKADKDHNIKKQLELVLNDFFTWVHGKDIRVKEYRNEIAATLATSLNKHGLYDYYEALQLDGRIRPETLLFTAFGVPDAIDIQ